MASRAMQRNKYIYCLADAGLVVSSDVEGGTWAGATEALEKDWHVPIYVRMSGTLPPGNSPLLQRGALRFPDPPWPTSLYRLTNLEGQPVELDSAGEEQLGLFGQDQVKAEGTSQPHISKAQSSTLSTRSANGSYGHLTDKTDQMNETEGSLSLDAYTAILPLLLHVLEKPRGIKEVASTINVKENQAKAWLQRALEEEHVECVKRKYVAIKFRFHSKEDHSC